MDRHPDQPTTDRPAARSARASESDRTSRRRPRHGADDPGSRFRGLDLPATLGGVLAAVGVLVLLGGLLAAAGSFGYQAQDADTTDDAVAIGGLVAGFLTLVVAFLVGGWVAGRMARYDGGRNGLVTAVWFLIIAAGFAVLGTWAGDRYDVFEDVELPQWFTADEATLAGAVSAAIGIVLVLLAGWAGGKLGERWHRKADEETFVARRTLRAEDEHVSGEAETHVAGTPDREGTRG